MRESFHNNSEGTDEDGQEALAHHHEQANHYFYVELDLLFKRFNFFLVATAFLMVAFVGVATSGSMYVIPLSHAIAVLGGFTSMAFFVINYLNAKVVKVRREYLRKEVHKYGKQNRSLFQMQVAMVDYLYQEIKPREWLRDLPKAVKRLATKPLSLSIDAPAYHTWAIPPVFYLVWMACWGVVTGWVAPAAFSAAMLVGMSIYIYAARSD